MSGRQEIVLPHVRKAESAFERMKGLLGSDEPASGEGMLISPCSSVHTLFMNFAIDVIFVNRKGIIVKIIPTLKPFRFGMAFGAYSVLELRAGEAGKIGITTGSHLLWIEQ